MEALTLQPRVYYPDMVVLTLQTRVYYPDGSISIANPSILPHASMNTSICVIYSCL